MKVNELQLYKGGICNPESFEHVQELNEKRSDILKEVLQKGERTFNEWLNGNQ
jgi:hypothetical protein